MTVWSDLFTDVDGTLISAHTPTSGFTYVRNLVRGSDHQNQILNNHLMKGGTAFGFGYPAYDSVEELNSRIARFGIDVYLPTLHDSNVPGLGIALRTEGNLSQRRLVIGVREQSLIQMRILFIGVTVLGGADFFLAHFVDFPVRDRVYRVELDIDEFDMARVYLDGVHLPALDQNVAAFLGNHIGLEGAGFDSEMWLDNLTITFGDPAPPECFPDTSDAVADPSPAALACLVSAPAPAFFPVEPAVGIVLDDSCIPVGSIESLAIDWIVGDGQDIGHPLLEVG